jgi:hypothetical protein
MVAPPAEEVAEEGDEAGTVAAEAEDGEATEEGAEEEAEEGGLPISISGNLGIRTNVGSLVRDKFAATDSVSMSLGLTLGYAFENAPGVSVSASTGYSKFLSPDGTTYQYEGRWGDTSLGASYDGFATIPGDIGLSASADVTLPTSRASRFERLRTAVGLGISASRGFGPVSLSYSLGASKNFHQYTSLVVDTDRYRIDAFARAGENDDLAGALVALDSGILSEWGVSNSLGLSYRTPVTGLSASLGISFSDAFTYADDSITSRDEYTSEFASPSRGHSQTMSGSFGASYSFLDHFSTGLRFSTSAAPKQSDNTGVRFPLWDLESGNLQYTSVSFSLSASY